MLHTNKKIMFRSVGTATCVGLDECAPEWVLTDELIYNEERDDSRKVSVLSCEEDGQLLYKALFIRWLIYVAAYIVAIVGAGILFAKTENLWVLFVLCLVTFIFGDRILCKPDKCVQDCEGNVLHVDVGWLYIPDKCVVKMN